MDDHEAATGIGSPAEALRRREMFHHRALCPESDAEGWKCIDGHGLRDDGVGFAHG